MVTGNYDSGKRCPPGAKYTKQQQQKEEEQVISNLAVHACIFTWASLATTENILATIQHSLLYSNTLKTCMLHLANSSKNVQLHYTS